MRRILPRELGDEDSTDALACLARPVLAEIHDDLRDLPSAFTLTNADGRALQWWSTNRRIEARLESLALPSGTSLAERTLGTCGAGIALVTGRSNLVLGPEHYATCVSSMASASAPILHPVTGRIVGAIALTCDLADATVLLLPWLRDQSAKIHRLLATSIRNGQHLRIDPDRYRAPTDEHDGMRACPPPSLDFIERHAIAKALRASHGNKQLAAQSLGIARSTLYRKMRAFGMSSP